MLSDFLSQCIFPECRGCFLKGLEKEILHVISALLIKIQLDLQVTTTTKTIREIQYIGPDGQPLDYVPSGAGQARLSSSSAAGVQPFPQLSYGGQDQQQQNQQPQHGYANYAEYPHRPPTPPSPSDRSNSPPPQHREPGKKLCASKKIVFHLFGAADVRILV